MNPSSRRKPSPSPHKWAMTVLCAVMAGSQDKTRCNLTTKVVSGEGAADKDSAEEWASGKLQDILWEYAPKDVFNMDESALFFFLRCCRTECSLLKGRPAREVSKRRTDYQLLLLST